MNKEIRKIIRKRIVIDKTGLSESTIDRREKAGEFPRRVVLGKNAIGYFEDEIIEFMNSLQRGNCAAPEAANQARRHKVAS